MTRRIEPGVARRGGVGGGIQLGRAQCRSAASPPRGATLTSPGCCAPPTARAAPSRSTGLRRRHRHRCWRRRPERKTLARSGAWSRPRQRSSWRPRRSPTCPPSGLSRAGRRSIPECRARPRRRRHRPDPRPRSRAGRGYPGRPPRSPARRFAPAAQDRSAQRFLAARQPSPGAVGLVACIGGGNAIGSAVHDDRPARPAASRQEDEGVEAGAVAHRHHRLQRARPGPIVDDLHMPLREERLRVRDHPVARHAS